MSINASNEITITLINNVTLYTTVIKIINDEIFSINRPGYSVRFQAGTNSNTQLITAMNEIVDNHSKEDLNILKDYISGANLTQFLVILMESISSKIEEINQEIDSIKFNMNSLRGELDKKTSEVCDLKTKLSNLKSLQDTVTNQTLESIYRKMSGE